MNFIIASILAAALVTATITDLKSQRIYNWLTFPLMFAGLLFHSIAGGIDGFLLSLAGFGLGLGIMLVPFLLGMMGAGDVKLMAGIGAWIGAENIFTAFFFTCLAGGFYALIILFKYREHAKGVLLNIKATFMTFIVTRKFEYAPTSEAVLPRLCYGVAIAVGTTAVVIMNFARTGSVLAQ